VYRLTLVLSIEQDDLVEVDEAVVVSQEQSDDSALIELVWRERLPLGMNLLMNDDSGVLKVVDFPRGSQARIVCEKRGFDPDAFKGASVIAVNGSSFDDQEQLFDALKDPGRPKTVLFRLADTVDAERLRKLLEGDTLSPPPSLPREFRFRKVDFLHPGELGLEFTSIPDQSGLLVSGFAQGDDGIVLAAKRSGNILIGDVLSHVNDNLVLATSGDGLSRTIDLLESATRVRPVSLTFVDPYMHKVVIPATVPGRGVDCSGGPTELDLTELHEGDRRRVIIKGFHPVSGMAEAGGILIGDHLVFVNGFPVGAGCRWLDSPIVPTLEEVYGMLKNESFYPIGLTFARPKQTASRWMASPQGISDSEVETICVTAESYKRLGIKLDNINRLDVVVSDFQAVPGVFQRSMYGCLAPNGNICLAVEAINGQFVPSYTTAEMVRNALSRSWKGGESIELVLCDNELKRWLSGQMP
jgi:hypothetical protein